MKFLKYLIFVVIFVILAAIMVVSTTEFQVQQPELYCQNTTGGNGSDCFENYTVILNVSEVCTISNGLCVSNSTIVGNLTNITDINDGVEVTGDIHMAHTNFYIGNGAAADGAFATAVGYQTNASGTLSAYFGACTISTCGALANFAVGIGINAQVPYNYGIGIGMASEITDEQGVAIGWGAEAGWRSVAAGADAEANGREAVALGAGAIAAYNRSIAIGYGVTTTANDEILIGDGSSPFAAKVTGDMKVVGDSAATETFIIEGAPAQASNLQEWQDSATTVLAYVDKDGDVCADEGELCLEDYGIAGYTQLESPNSHIVYTTGAASGSHIFQGTTFDIATLTYMNAPTSIVWAGTHTLAETGGALVLQNSAAGSTFEISGSSSENAFFVNETGGITINEDGNPSRDLRVEGDTETNMLLVDSKDNKVGIGTDMISANNFGTFNVDGVATFETSFYIDRTAGDLSAYTGFIQRQSGAACGFGLAETGCSELHTYSSSSDINAFVIGNVQAEPLVFATNNDEQARIDSNGRLGIGTDSSITAQTHIIPYTTTEEALLLQGTAGQVSDYMNIVDSSGDEHHEWKSNGDYYVHDSNRILFTNTTGGTSKYMYVEMDGANRGWIQANDAPIYLRAPDSSITIASSNFEQAMSSVWDMKYAGTTYMRVQQGLTIGNGLIGSYAQAQDGDAQFGDQVRVGEALSVGDDIQMKIKVNTNDRVGLVIEANDTIQLANLTEWRDNTGTVIGAIDKDGEALLKTPHGNMWFHNDTGQEVTISSTGVFYNITEGWNQSTEAGGHFDHFYRTDHKLVVNQSGVYWCRHDESFSGSPNNEYQVSIFVNGVEELASAAHRVLGTGGDVGNSGGQSFVASLAVGDEITLAVKNKDSAGNPSFQTAQISCLYIGIYE